MSILVILVPLSLLLGMGFVFSFVTAAKGGQFDDCETPAFRMLSDDEPVVVPQTGKDENNNKNCYENTD